MFPTVAMWTGKKQDGIKERVFSHQDREERVHDMTVDN